MEQTWGNIRSNTGQWHHCRMYRMSSCSQMEGYQERTPRFNQKNTGQWKKKWMICNFFHSHHKPKPNTFIPCDPPLTVSDSNMNSDEIMKLNRYLVIPVVKLNESPMTKLHEPACNVNTIRPEPDNMSDMTQ